MQAAEANTQTWPSVCRICLNGLTRPARSHAVLQRCVRFKPLKTGANLTSNPTPDTTFLIWSPPICKAIVRGEEGGCGLISGLDRGTCPPAPMDFTAKVLI